MSKEEIIIISMVIATLIMILKWFVENLIVKAMFKRGVKRTKYIEQLVKDDVIPFVLINIDNEPKRIENPKDNSGLIVDKKLYNDKNAYFLQRDGRVYIIGKKEDFMIALVGGYIGK